MPAGAILHSPSMGSLDPQVIVLATLAASLVLFVTDAVRYDAVAIGVVLVLAGTGVLNYEEAFASFAAPAVVLVASMYAFAAAVSRAGITEGICNRMFRKKESESEGKLTFKVVLVTGLMSSVLSNAAVVATMIPVLGSLSRRLQIPASRLLMPMAFGSLLGGMLTVIGTSKNIAVNGAIERLGAEPFGLFDFSLFGFILLIIGGLYFLGPGRLLLPRGRVDTTLSEHYRVPEFLTEVLVEPGSTLINRPVFEIDVFERFDIKLLGLIRAGGEKVMAPGPYNRIRTDDVLMLQGEPNSIVRMRVELGLRQRHSVEVGDIKLTSDDVQLVEGVVPATSTLVGATIRSADFRDKTGVNCLAISQHGDLQLRQITEIPLQVGDTLLLQGHAHDLHRLTESRELIVLGEHHAPDLGRNALITGLVLAVVLLLGASKLVHISVAALGGAVSLVLLRTIRPDDVRRSIDWSVLILIGGMLALGRAFQNHGLDTLVAKWMSGISGDIQNPILIIGMLFTVSLALTQVINHLAAAVIMTPVAFSLATELGISDRACFMAVLTGAEFAFMSPVAHQANAMIMGPGDYKYRDFLKCGTPLSVLLVIVGTILIPLIWPLR